MNWVFYVLLFLAASYLVLGMYGKYRSLKDAYLDERESSD